MTRLTPKIRKLVRTRAKGSCEYCLIPEEYGTLSFQIDHIIPLMHLGTNKLDNLAWSCPKCNNRKGTNIATLEPHKMQLTPLYHPRQQYWSDHFQLLRNGRIEGTSSIGIVTLGLLDLNFQPDVATRRFILENEI